jgi:hypothetical protein
MLMGFYTSGEKEWFKVVFDYRPYFLAPSGKKPGMNIF